MSARTSSCHDMQWAKLGESNSSAAGSLAQEPHHGAAEWTGKHQGYLEKRSGSRFALFGARWKRRWSVRLPLLLHHAAGCATSRAAFQPNITAYTYCSLHRFVLSAYAKLLIFETPTSPSARRHVNLCASRRMRISSPSLMGTLQGRRSAADLQQRLRPGVRVGAS